MSGHWWRAYDEAVDDPKLQRLAPELFRAWFNIMCLASGGGGVLPPIADIAFKLRVKEEKAETFLAALRVHGLLDDVGGQMKPHNWDARQFKSDVSTERVKRFRKQKGNVSSAVSETPPETETETETEKKEPDANASGRARKRTAETSLPADWQPSEADRAYAKGKGWSDERIAGEAERFKNHAEIHERKAKRWPAAWRNWVTSPFQGQTNGRQNAQPQQNGLVAAGERRLAQLAEIRRNLESGAGPAGDGGLHGGDPDVCLLPAGGRGAG